MRYKESSLYFLKEKIMKRITCRSLFLYKAMIKCLDFSNARCSSKRFDLLNESISSDSNLRLGGTTKINYFVYIRVIFRSRSTEKDQWRYMVRGSLLIKTRMKNRIDDGTQDKPRSLRFLGATNRHRPLKYCKRTWRLYLRPVLLFL